MQAAASELEFERAARLRDQLGSVRKAIERQQMVGDKDEDYDAIGLAEDDLEASIQVFNVRRGRMVGRKGLVLEKVEDSRRRPSSYILEMLYGDAAPEDVPKEVLLPVEPDDLALYEEFLCHVRGSKVRIRVPKRGNKRAFLETVTKNAEDAFTRHRLKRASDHNARARALTALQDALDLHNGRAPAATTSSARLPVLLTAIFTVVECDVPAAGALREGIDRTRRFSRRLPECLRRPDLGVMDIFFGIFRAPACLDELDADHAQQGSGPRRSRNANNLGNHEARKAGPLCRLARVEGRGRVFLSGRGRTRCRPGQQTHGFPVVDHDGPR